VFHHFPRLTWRRPAKADVLQFTGTEVTALGILRDQFRIAPMPTVNEQINLCVLFRTILKLRFTRWDYYATFVRMSDCRVVVVWHDTNVHALRLKPRVQAPVICIQNGVRHDLGPATGAGYFTSIQQLPRHVRPQVSDYWVFGETSRQILATHIDANYHIHGSVRANHYATIRAEQRVPRSIKSVALIASFPHASEVPTGQILNNHHPFLRKNSQQISYHDWFQIDMLAAKAMVHAASNMGITCYVIAKRAGADTSEHRFFREMIDGGDLRVVDHEKGDGYRLADNFDFLIATDSTLGYEMLALGKKVAFFTGRLTTLGINSNEMAFGHPLPLPSIGEFWSSATNEAEMCAFLKSFFSIDDHDWIQLTAEIVPLVMSVDPNNSALRRQLAEYVGYES
jgi:surface carbohydrate biosynthesis protein